MPNAEPSAALARRPAASAELMRVDITGAASTTTARRQSTAAKIIIGREAIEQLGDSSLIEVLKRLPSVTIGGRPGRGGSIRMRGMGWGYTQILIDGERMPPGFALDQLDPDQVERIEILRSPNAETGTRAISGTINIVLREPLRRRGDDLRIALGIDGGRPQPSLSWTRNVALGATGTAGLSLSATRTEQTTDTRTDATTTQLGTLGVLQQRAFVAHRQEQRDGLTLNGRLQWRLGDGDQLTLQPVWVLSRSQREGQGSMAQTVGTEPAPYATSQSAGRSESNTARLSAFWRTRLGEGGRLELRGSGGTFALDSAGQLDQFDAVGQPGLTQLTSTRIRDRSASLNGKLFHALGESHKPVGGLEAEHLQRQERLQNQLNGVDALADFGGDVQASSQRLALYAQDERDPSPQVSAYAGLRWEAITTRSSSGGVPVRNLGQVVTPLLHAVWRLDAAKRVQLRASLTKSYRAATLQNLVSLPSLSTLNPVPGSNTASRPGPRGQPRPEARAGAWVRHRLRALPAEQRLGLGQPLLSTDQRPDPQRERA